MGEYCFVDDTVSEESLNQREETSIICPHLLLGAIGTVVKHMQTALAERIGHVVTVHSLSCSLLICQHNHRQEQDSTYQRTYVQA